LHIAFVGLVGAVIETSIFEVFQNNELGVSGQEREVFENFVNGADSFSKDENMCDEGFQATNIAIDRLFCLIHREPTDAFAGIEIVVRKETVSEPLVHGITIEHKHRTGYLRPARGVTSSRRKAAAKVADLWRCGDTLERGASTPACSGWRGKKAGHRFRKRALRNEPI
jgi:hypothetical protein